MSGSTRNDEVLLQAIKAKLPDLKLLLAEANNHWSYEDGIYRFYHHSFKVFFLQHVTRDIVEELQALLPDCKLNTMFQSIYEAGTSSKFDMKRTNANWEQETRPIVEAFLHAKFFLEMAVKYGEELEHAADLLPSGWAAFLYLFNLR